MCIWIPDADGIAMNDRSLGILYTNKRIDDFLNSKKVLGVSGIKGQGKTFLLKVKRANSEKSAVECFPKNSMVDQLDNSTKINPSLINYLEDYTIWVSIWKVAIAMTIINSELIEATDRNKLFERLPESCFKLAEISNENCRPSVIINHLLQMKKKILNQILTHTSELLELLIGIHEAVHIFVDKTDQAFATDVHRVYGDSKMSRGPRNASFWQYSQYALANAAYDIFSNINQHIKVYYTIRQEALIDAHLIAPNLCRNINSYIISLEYSKHDLEEMFKIYVGSEEDENLNDSSLKSLNPIKAFLGIDTIENAHVGTIENLFDYIYRHSLQRPSDIMTICKKLSFDNKTVDVTKVRTIVNECAGEILDMYLAELSPFLPSNITGLFFNINTNILSEEYLKYICNRFRSQQSVFFSCTRNCETCKTINPFKVLFNIGLIGYIDYDVDNSRRIQSFNKMGSSTFFEKDTQFPSSEFYFVHPCLTNVVRRKRGEFGLPHFTNENCVVGDGYLFQEKLDDGNEMIKKIRELIFNAKQSLIKENVFVSSTINNLKIEREAIKEALMQRGLSPVLSETENFPLNFNLLNRTHSHDYCLRQLDNCGCLISILGTESGGTYSGSEFSDLCDEIIEASEGRITKPSISLMEYYLAVKKNIPHYAFIHIDYDDEECRNTSWGKELIAEYKFITHLRIDGQIQDNWVTRYSDLDGLQALISNLTL